MKIKFLQDYRGVLTNEEYYKKGDVADIAQASALIDAGRAEAVAKPKVVEEKVKPKKVTKPKDKK